MDEEKSLVAFEKYKIRRFYDEKNETWYFSVVDIIAVLIQQPNYQAARNYWKVLKNRLKKEGSETVTNCNRLKMVAEDGKMRLTDEQIREKYPWDYGILTEKCKQPMRISKPTGNITIFAFHSRLAHVLGKSVFSTPVIPRARKSHSSIPIS